MSRSDDLSKSDRPALPRDGFRAQRVSAVGIPRPVVVTPDYDEPQRPASPVESPAAAAPRKSDRARSHAGRDPLRAYGERSSSRPYALRLPEPIDRVLRHIAAEERTQPLRIIDRLIYDHLKRIGRLPASGDP